MSFLFSRTFRRKKTPAPIPGGEPLLLFLGPFISQAKKKTQHVWWKYILYIYIYNVVESRKNPIYHIFMVDFYIHMING